MKEFGKHYLIELIECEPEAIASVAKVQEAMLRAAEVSRATVLEYAFHQFEPQGVSGFIFIAESHFSVHTWPESRYAGVDIFTCGAAMNADAAIAVLSSEFSASKTRVRLFSRGIEEAD